MPVGKTGRRQVVVYLDERDHLLLERVVKETGLAKTELLRRGLHRLAEEVLRENGPGSAFRHMIETSRDDGFPADVAERHDHYLYGGGYETALKQKKRAGAR